MQAHDAVTQMVAEPHSENAARRSEVVTLRGELSVQHDELAVLRRTVQGPSAGGAGAGGHRAVAGPEGSRKQRGPTVFRPLVSTPLGPNAVTRAAARPPHATPIVPPSLRAQLC